MITLYTAIEQASIICLSKIFDADNTTITWIDLMNVEIQKILPGPYILYLDTTNRHTDWLKWKTIDDSNESILFELTYR